MFEELGGLFGWLLVFAFIGTILNYCIKFVNKRFGKKIFASPVGKKIMKPLMAIFVRNHKYFGFSAGVFLIIHFVIQFTNIGPSITGLIAAILMIFQVGLGIYANVKKKPRKGVWFIAHRTLAVLLILGIFIHILYPFGMRALGGRESSYEVTENADVSQLQIFTLEELSKYDGKDGNNAYVAYKGYVYDVTDISKWKNGEHNGQKAGTDLTEEISKSPHGDSVFERLEIVGKME